VGDVVPVHVLQPPPTLLVSHRAFADDAREPTFVLQAALSAPWPRDARTPRQAQVYRWACLRTIEGYAETDVAWLHGVRHTVRADVADVLLPLWVPPGHPDAVAALASATDLHFMRRALDRSTWTLDAADALTWLTHDTDFRTRFRALSHLHRLGGPIPPHLRDDPEPRVRHRTLGALAERGDATALAALQHAEDRAHEALYWQARLAPQLWFDAYVDGPPEDDDRRRRRVEGLCDADLTAVGTTAQWHRLHRRSTPQDRWLLRARLRGGSRVRHDYDDELRDVFSAPPEPS
jgi:hypothetical protein